MGDQTPQRLVEQLMRARQLNRERELEALSRLVTEELSRVSARFSLRVRVGNLYAEPLTRRYGIEYEIFSYAGSLQKERVASVRGPR